MLRLILPVAAVFPMSGALGADFYAISRADRTLHRLGVGPATLVGQLSPLAASADLAMLVRAPDGLAYTVDRGANRLITLRLSDAAVVASVQLDQDMWVTRRGLAVGPDGVLWGVLPGMQLRTINPATGHCALVSGITGATIIEGLAFSPQGTLYAIGDDGIEFSRHLYTINTVSGVATPVAALPVVDIDSLTWGADGLLYGADSDGAAADLYRIDPQTGHMEVAGNTGIVELNGLMSIPSCYADCNADGALSLSDFGCFRTRFALGEPYADCNGDGMTNLADFGCFQTTFALGCP